ncbi:hypothetical protein BT93_H2471 [Corymbia citriodora subsp. variegata]|nr:hypothetical protein BT93_H2471 [Corymbia citriodora subsp. variegata]
MEVAAYQPYIDPDYDSLIERIYPSTVCIDNETCRDCTLVKVDSANKDGILLEMVQVLTDLDLVISKSYISSDGGWFMDVFHVTDQLGKKLVDKSLILYIQQALCATRRGGLNKEIHGSWQRKHFRPCHVSSEHTVLEMTGTNRLGLLSEMSAALAELACHIASAVVWTHHARAACIFYVEDGESGGPITDPGRLAQIEEQLENVVEAHHAEGERRSVRLMGPVAGRTHTERRLHQLMFADRDYEQCHHCGGGSRHQKGCEAAHVSIERWKDKGYSVVNVRSRDRPKLLFDTVCVLTDMQYVVFHASVSSAGSFANQEYFIRHQDGCALDSETEQHKLSQCLLAAVERRALHGLRLEVSTQNRPGLLSDVTRVFRENGLSITRAEVGIQGEQAVGSFYVTEASGNDVSPSMVELVRKEIGGSVMIMNKSSGASTPQGPMSALQASHVGRTGDEKPRPSLGSLIWSQLERFSSNFGPVRL